jgi:uncharacterized RDD family membrane protein YckC
MDSQNPFQSPLAPTFLDNTAQEKPIVASQGQRFLNLLVDQVCCFALSFCIGIVLAVLGAQEVLESVPNLLFGMAIMLVYYIPQEMLFGRTIAKLLTGTKVVAIDGSTATFGQILGRTFARMIPFEAFSYFGGKQPVGWHDSLSGTRVVRAR